MKWMTQKLLALELLRLEATINPPKLNKYEC